MSRPGESPAKNVEIARSRPVESARFARPLPARDAGEYAVMINVAAIRMQQFGVQFYQASLTASDIDKLVRFEVLQLRRAGAQPASAAASRSGAAPSKINWDLLERRIASNEKAYQRQIIRRKIDELVQYYEQCRQARDLPSIPGAVIISCDEKLTFRAGRATTRASAC